MAGWLNRKQHDVIMYLHTENEILKEQLEKKGVKMKLSNAQRYKLAKKGKKLGRQGLMQYASIVTPDTILAWHRKLVAMKYTAKRMMKTGRQKRMEVIRGLCVQFAEENTNWGYGRIQGALSNLGYKVSMTTVGNILRAQGIVPSPERGKESNLQTFVRCHMDVMSAADFFTAEVWTLRGLVRYHVFFVMNLAQRQVEIVHIGCQVNGAVMAQLARNMTDSCDGILKAARYFVCDHDPLYTKDFRQLLTDTGVEVIDSLRSGLRPRRVALAPLRFAPSNKSGVSAAEWLCGEFRIGHQARVH
jgi:hypothetical protein